MGAWLSKYDEYNILQMWFEDGHQAQPQDQREIPRVHDLSIVQAYASHQQQRLYI